MADKYVGWIVQIIYQDAKGAITQRTIRVVSIADGKVMGFDIGKKAPRPFRADRILAAQPICRYAS